MGFVHFGTRILSPETNVEWNNYRRTQGCQFQTPCAVPHVLYVELGRSAHLYLKGTTEGHRIQKISKTHLYPASILMSFIAINYPPNPGIIFLSRYKKSQDVPYEQLIIHF